MNRKIFTFGLLLIFLSYPKGSFCISREDAYRAAELLKPRMVVRFYCPPCGDTSWKNVTVKKVSVKQIGSDYELLINGSVINPAHFYIKIHGNWVNVAMLIGMEVSNVPEFLPANDRVP